MRFNIIYKFLSQQIYKPTTKAKCRVYMAKDLRAYQKQYYNVMHQLIGSHWNPILQNVDYDNMLLKKVVKFVSLTILFVLLLFVFF